ncbi:MAG: hypothetical protein HC808_01450 [Candidatus Competibacteraceae bacterium]|nr:hypothetical protein [Candidatus Competibacteraceae bacterium]
MRPIMTRILSVLLLLSGAASEAAQPIPAITHSADTNTLSARLERTPLAAVLTELGRQSGIAVFVHPASADAEITAEFDDLPLRAALKRLLNDHSYVLINEQREQGGSGIATIHVLKQDFTAPPKQNDTATSTLDNPTSSGAEALLQALWATTNLEARAAALQLIAEHDLAGLLEAIKSADPQTREAVLANFSALAQWLPLSLLSEVAASDPDPVVRMNALALLNELGQEAYHSLAQTSSTATRETELALLSKAHSETLIGTATTALGDAHPDVRGMALETVNELASRYPPPLEAVTAMALNDPQPELRLRALALLVTSGQTDAQGLLNRALHDADPMVREQALDLLAEFNTNDR